MTDIPRPYVGQRRHVQVPKWVPKDLARFYLDWAEATCEEEAASEVRKKKRERERIEQAGKHYERDSLPTGQ